LYRPKRAKTGDRNREDDEQPDKSGVAAWSEKERGPNELPEGWGVKGWGSHRAHPAKT
jgi:hypothetical protein